jgi:hypothetical protein
MEIGTDIARVDRDGSLVSFCGFVKAVASG